MGLLQVTGSRTQKESNRLRRFQTDLSECTITIKPEIAVSDESINCRKGTIKEKQQIPKAACEPKAKKPKASFAINFLSLDEYMLY